MKWIESDKILYKAKYNPVFPSNVKALARKSFLLCCSLHQITNGKRKDNIKRFPMNRKVDSRKRSWIFLISMVPNEKRKSLILSCVTSVTKNLWNLRHDYNNTYKGSLKRFYCLDPSQHFGSDLITSFEIVNNRQRNNR